MKKIIIAVSVCSILLLGGCKSGEINEASQVISDQEEEGKVEPVTMEEVTQNESTSGDEEVGEGKVVIEAGPDKKIWNDGSIIYTMHDFKLFESPQAALIDSKNMDTIDAEYYADRSIFLLLQVDINNIDAPGDYEDGSINVSRFTIVPKQQGDMDWEGSWPVYLSEPGEGPDFYHVLINKGETKTIAIGFFVPVSSAEELCSKCQIAMNGSYDDGYLYEIPEIK